MTGQIKYQANPVISFKDEGDEGAVLYNPDKDKCVIINTVGSVIWRYLEEPKTPNEIVAMLAESFSDVDTGKAREDLEQFINNCGEDFIDAIS